MSFQHDGFIVVESGAKLIIESCTLKAFINPADGWSGIQIYSSVIEDPYGSQNYIKTTPGKAYIYNSTISNLRGGINADGDAILHLFYTEILDFIGDAVSVYNATVYPGIDISSFRSIISNCTFWASMSSCSKDIVLVNVDMIGIWGNKFINNQTGSNFMGIGILIDQSNVTIGRSFSSYNYTSPGGYECDRIYPSGDPNYFSNLAYGIVIDPALLTSCYVPRPRSSGGYYFVCIWDNTFDNNLISIGTMPNNDYYDITVYYNRFNYNNDIYSASFSQNPQRLITGIYTEGEQQQLKVYKNTFTFSCPTVDLTNSGIVSGIYSKGIDNMFVYSNTFKFDCANSSSNFDKIISRGNEIYLTKDNPQIKINCNTYEDLNLGWLVDNNTGSWTLNDQFGNQVGTDREDANNNFINCRTWDIQNLANSFKYFSQVSPIMDQVTSVNNVIAKDCSSFDECDSLWVIHYGCINYMVSKYDLVDPEPDVPVYPTPPPAYKKYHEADTNSFGKLPKNWEVSYSNENITIYPSVSDLNGYMIEIIDIYGKVCSSEIISKSTSVFTINKHNLKKGIYIIKFMRNNKIEQKMKISNN